jgi:type IV pilus assembly protein PilE
MCTKPVRGFTLIEVLIVVVIIGVISAIAYPAYGQYVLRGYRADAKVNLLEAAQWMERNYSLTQDYRRQANNDPIDNAALAAQPFGKVPRDATGTAVRYTLTFQAGPALNTFTLQAVPQNGQAADAKCGTLRLNEVQRRTASGPEGSVNCWAR